MTRTMYIEEVKKMLNEDTLNMEQVFELAEELIAHVDYWEQAERSAVKTLTKMLSDARDEIDKSNNMINFSMELSKRTDAMIEARDQKIKDLENKLAEYKKLNGGNEK